MEPAPARRATLADVARAAEVSTSTASVVFSGKARVSAATRERVFAAAAALGYAGPDPLAASLRRGRSGIVAVVFEGTLRAAFLDPVTIAMMEGLTDALDAAHAGVLLLRDEPGEPGAEALSTAPVDAVVLIGCSGRTRQSLDIVRARGLPVVVIEGDAGAGAAQISLDSTEAARALAAHVRALGHARAAVVTLPLDADRERGPVTPGRLRRATVDIVRERLDGVRRVFPDAPALSAAGSSIDEGVLAGRTLLGGLGPRPTVILAQSDLLAAGVIRAAEEQGIHVPQDLSVTGFDGITVDGIGAHRLTTSVQPAVEKGRAAGEQVVRMLDGQPPGSLRFACRFQAGTTTAPPPATAAVPSGTPASSAAPRPKRAR